MRKGFVWLSLAFLTLQFSTACTRKEQAIEISQRSEVQTLPSKKLVPGQFKEVPASELLDASAILDYPADYPFVPTFLGDDGLVYGYSMDEQNGKSSLVYLDSKSGDYKTLKAVDFQHSPVTFGTYYADKEITVFHEYHYENQHSSYYLWTKETDSLTELITIPGVSPLHFSEVARWNQDIFLVTSDASGNYPILRYDLAKQEMSVLEEKNSGYPLVVGDDLYYLLLDNEQLKTELVRYHLPTSEKKVLTRSQGHEAFYNGLCAHGKELILMKQMDNRVIFERGIGEQSEEILQTDHAEVVSCHQGFLSYIGTSRNSEDGRMLPYLYNLDHQIAYQYDHSVLYLSNVGIFWVEYLKPSEEIGPGTIFTAENSRMRFLSFEEMRKK
ncbi:hypothetical protein JN540_00995 [Streptococcus suis]|nr:hypothetical protein [Streptococcus suis]